MSQFDWDPEKLLNFDYGKPVPDRNSTTESKKSVSQQNNAYGEHSHTDEAQLYAALRKEKENQRQAEIDAQRRAEAEAQRKAEQLRIYQESQRRHEEEKRRQYAQQEAERSAQFREQQEAQYREQQEAQLRAHQEAQYRAQQEAQLREQQEVQYRAQQDEAKKQAQIEAYERYRAQSRNSAQAESNDRKSRALSDKLGRGNTAVSEASRGMAKFHKIGRILKIIYLITLVAFGVSMTIMNVLPFILLISMFAILGLITLFLFYEYRQKKLKKWQRRVTVAITIILIIVYSVGTAYAMGTLNFLASTSVKNEKKVGKITEEPFNVLITGMDVTGHIDEQGRSDVNMVVTVNPKTQTILMTSIPRDYEIRMPDKDYATDKLTHTGFYSVNTTILAVEDLLDIDINYYVKVNFTTVKAFINIIGGVDVYSEYEFTPEKAPEWTCKKGWNHMDGRQALGFARERHAFEDGDNQRVKNQQAVLEAMIKKASSPTMVLRYSKVITYLDDYFEMSFSSRELRALVKYQIAKNPDWKIYKNKIEGPGATKTTYTGGSQPLYVMEQDPTSIGNAKSLITAVQEGKKLQKDKSGNVTVTEDSSDTE